MNAQWLGVPASNFMPGRNAAQIQTVIIHTMVGTLAGANGRFQNASAQVSAHYGVQLDGSLVQWVNEADTAYHAGDWSVNLTSIGIEHEDGGNYDAPRTDALYKTAAALVKDICTRNNIPIDRVHIKGHREVHATACPDALDIDRIVREATTVAPVAPILGYSRYFTAPPGTEAWASLYRALSPHAGVRAEIAFAQALKETNNFTFTGTAQASWNNPAGLGVTGAPDTGNRFSTPEDGVRAHLGHLLWYVGPTHPIVGFCDKDQRHFGAHKNYPNDVTSLNGKWAVPGVGYGESIAAIAARITTEVPVTDDEFKEKFGRLIAPGLEAEIQQRKQESIDGAVKAVAAKLSA